MVKHLSLLCFTSLTQGWVAGQGTIAHTSDGGAHWSVQLAIKPTISSLSFATASDGWAAAGGVVYRTTDGGAHWEHQTTAPFASWIVGLKPAGAAVLARPIYGGSGGLASTSDGGATWIAQASGTTADLNDVHFIDPADGWAVGDQGVIANSTNGGATWTAQASGVTDDLRGVSFVDAQHGWAVGHSPDTPTTLLLPTPVILATTDGGAHWLTQTAPLPYDAELRGVVFADAAHGWAVGTILGDVHRTASVILATTDGGATWKRQLAYLAPQDENVPEGVLTAIACSDARHLIAVGLDDLGCEIFRSADGGATWTGLSRAATSSLGYPRLSGVAMAGAARGWPVGECPDGSGIVLETTNGGATWHRQSVGAQVDAVSFASPTHGWVAGVNANILTTTTAGNAP